MTQKHFAHGIVDKNNKPYFDGGDESVSRDICYLEGLVKFLNITVGGHAERVPFRVVSLYFEDSTSDD